MREAPATLRALVLTDQCDPAPGQGPRKRDGLAALPVAPGLGVEPSRERLGPPHSVCEV
jgi:L-alanine-DL-glutamate epimerase-like enolase superfamily enzyme